MITDRQTLNEYSPVSLDLINSPALSNSSDNSSRDFSFTHSSVSPVGSREGLESPELKGCSATAFAAARTTWSSDGAAAYGGGGNDGNCTEGSLRVFAGGRGRGVAEVVSDSIVRGQPQGIEPVRTRGVAIWMLRNANRGAYNLDSRYRRAGGNVERAGDLVASTHVCFCSNISITCNFSHMAFSVGAQTWGNHKDRVSIALGATSMEVQLVKFGQIQK